MQAGIKIEERETAQQPGFETELHPVLKKILLNRHVSTDGEYQLNLSELEAPDQLANIDAAVGLLYEVMRQQGRILIVGDFDADGATSTALTWLCLKALGHQQVDYLVPNRFEFGYGLTPEIVAIASRKQPVLIITVDNGIASFAGVEKARELGIRVLITDHHLPAATLPAADCILNPNLPDCRFPSKVLAGVGVVFYLMLALRSFLRTTDWFEQREIAEPNMLQFLDLVALGTVADVVPLDRNNRCLVKHGLGLIRSGRARPGINALLEVAGRNRQKLVAADLGFAVGPRLNAAGRLDDMSLGIECLLADDPFSALRLARQLDDLNQDRKSIEQTMQVQALEVLESLDFNVDASKGLCLFDPQWHQGVVGILASRLKDRFHRPVIVFAVSGEAQDEIKGSARSIKGLHIRDLLDAIATRHPGLLNRFGGHAMAAGLTLGRADFERFHTAFLAELDRRLDAAMLEKVLYTDGELPADCLDLAFAELLEVSGPWGQQFPEPVFTGRFTVQDQRKLSGDHLKLLLGVPGAGISIDAIAFRVPAAVLEQQLAEIEVAYQLQVNEFRGQRSVQILIEHFIRVS